MKKRVAPVFLMGLILWVLVACTAPSADSPELEETAVPTDLPSTATTEPVATATAMPSDTPEPATDIPATATEPPATETAIPATEPPATETAIPPTESPTAATEEPAATSSALPPSMSAQISIQDFQFSPGNITIQTGSTVTWTHIGNINHTVTADDGSFDSGSLGGGDVFKFTFTEAGIYNYFCEFHGGPGGSGMSGTITVVDY